MNGRSKSGYVLANFRATRDAPLKVHRLVAQVFVKGQASGLVVNHIDGDKANNRADNLEWVTIQENTAHAVEMGLTQRSASHATLNESDVLEIRHRYAQGESVTAMAREFGVIRPTIVNVTRGRSWSHIGGPVGKRPKSLEKRVILKGEQTSGAKLTDDEVLELRELYAEGATSGDLSERFGLDASYTLKIVNGEYWSHVGGPLGTRSIASTSDKVVKKFFKLRGKGAKLTEIRDYFEGSVGVPTISTYLLGKRRPDLYKKFKHYLEGAVDHRVKITDDDVKEIQRLRKGGWTQKECAIEFKVSESLIKHIDQGRRSV